MRFIACNRYFGRVLRRRVHAAAYAAVWTRRFDRRGFYRDDGHVLRLSWLAIRGFFAGSRVRVGLLALPLCGAAVTFFAAAKKVTKETTIPSLSTSHRPRHRRLAKWHGSSECPHKTHRAWTAHGLPHQVFKRAGSAPKSFGTALRAAVGYARETVEEEAHADPIDPSAAKRAGALWCCTSEA